MEGNRVFFPLRVIDAIGKVHLLLIDLLVLLLLVKFEYLDDVFRNVHLIADSHIVVMTINPVVGCSCGAVE